MIEFSVTTGEHEVRTVMQLRTRFFKFHTDKIRKPKWPRPVLQSLDPITLVLNPPQLHNARDPSISNCWYAVYYRKFFVTIEQNRLSTFSGPHVARLCIQIPYRTNRFLFKTEWLGTAQYGGSFFNESDVRVFLRRAIRTRQYFVAESTEEVEIDMNPSYVEDNASIAI